MYNCNSVLAMQCLNSIIVLAVYFHTCSGRNNTVCTDSKLCDCRTISYFKVEINCHGRGLNISNVCGICAKIDHAQILDVGGNSLSNIPNACFEQCTELEELHLDSNNLTVLTKDAFTGLKLLKRLNVNNNSLITDGRIHDPELFTPLKLLEELHIQKNMKSAKPEIITYLSNVANGTLGNLERLYIDGLPNGRFGTNFLSFQNILMISLSGSPIFNLTNGTFVNVRRIQILDMSYCNLTRIEADTFEPLKALKFLNLSNNMGLGFPSLRNISYGLRDSTSIAILDYSKVYKTFGLTTQLNRCDVWYLQNTTLKELYINSNRMASIELDALRLMPMTLETVFIEDNQLTYAPYVFQGGCITNLKRLEMSRQNLAHDPKNFNHEVDIADNELDSSGGCQIERQTLKPGCWSGKHKPLKPIHFHFPYKLKYIGASQSKIRYGHSKDKLIPLPLRNSVETIDLSYNLIYKWNNPLVIFHDLKLLNLSHNFCSNITRDFFKNCPNLETFDASYNRLGQVLGNDIHGMIFAKVTGLRILNISGSWIAKLPQKAFIYLGSLEHLDLSYNMLEKIDFQFQHMENLTTLSLRQNKISYLPLNLLELMKKSS